MATLTQPIAPEPIAIVPASTVGGESRLLIGDAIDWAGYEALSDLLGASRTRVYYLEGTVELMTTGLQHERFKRALGRMVDLLVFELDIPANALGSMTFRREGARRGLEPDECYYIAHVDRVQDAAEKLDLETTPPPDLVIEVELTSPLLNKLLIYAGLGVPEIWRFDGRTLTVLVLQPDGVYIPSETSRAFPWLPMSGFAGQLRNYQPQAETRWARAYRDWVRDVVAPLVPR